ncbi:hypothetical protein [Amycolatopsis sp. NPDC004378]
MTVYRVVVGVDLGTHGTSVGWVPVIAGQADPARISVFEGWPGGRPGIDVKTPTAVLVDEENRIVAWGFDAFAQAGRLRAGRPGSGVRLLHGFKMSLAPKSHTATAATSGIGLADDEPEPEKLIAGFLGHVYRTVLAELRCHFPGLQEEEIRWCVTVPAMWDDREKLLVRRAAYEAGLPSGERDEQLLLALEPDAVAHNAQVSGIDYVTVDGQARRRGNLAADCRFMVVDAGGGTIDITCFAIDAEGYLTEIDREGIAQGSLYVNRALKDRVLIDRLGGQAEFDRINEAAPHAITELLEDWETKKRTVTAAGEETILLSRKMSLAKQLSDEVADRLDTEQDGDDENIWISADEARSAFDAVIPDILALVDRRLDSMTAEAAPADKPDLVLLAGGFAESPYFRHRLAEHLRGRAVVAVTPQPRVDVVEGAVRFAYNPKVRARRSRYTVGTDLCMEFEHGVDPVASMVRDAYGVELCSNRFDVFIKAGQLVPVEHEVVKYYVPISGSTDSVTIDFFRTADVDPRYLDHKTCELFASCSLKIDLSEVQHLDLDKRGIVVSVKFGETEMHVSAVLEANGAKQEATLQFSAR